MVDIRGLLRFYIDAGIDNFFRDEESKKVHYTHELESNDSVFKDDTNQFFSGTLEDISRDIRNFTGCDLIKTAINTVIYDGNPAAKIMLVGEAPGASEDEQGIPFCGQSGKLLGNILKSIGLSREGDVFITNTVFWRPPGNRRPTADEISLCKPFLEKMIAVVNPAIIILVGSTAVESVLDIKAVSMNELRNSSHMYFNNYLDKPIRTVTIFHPSYLLRQPSQKKTMWFDMLKIKGIIDKL